MKQTFYTVKFRALGADAPAVAWFSRLDAAREFYRAAAAADPIRARTFSRPDSIRAAVDAVDVVREATMLERLQRSNQERT